MPLGAWGLKGILLVFIKHKVIRTKYLHRPDELIFAACLLLLVERRWLVLLETVVALTDDTLDGRELARLLLDTHDM